VKPISTSLCQRSPMDRFYCAMLVFSCVIAHAVVVSEARLVGTHVANRVVPKLNPESDKKFFGKDYPIDRSPTAHNLKFDHPYPHVQDSGDFDKDYVKDENSDSGAWKAQTEYDKLRGKLRKEQNDAKEARAKEEEAEETLDKTILEKKEADRQLEATKDKVDDMERQVEEAEEEVEKTKKKHEELPDASGDTQKAIHNLEDCKDQLHKARRELTGMLGELKHAKEAEKAAEGKEDDAKQKERTAENIAKEAEKVVTKETKEYKTANKVYEIQKEKVDTMEDELAEVEKKIKAYRQQADDGGGVYNVDEPKSAAPPMASPLAASSLLVTLVALMAS